MRDYWTRQFETIDSRVEPEGLSTGADGRIVVTVHQIVRDPAGNVISDGMVEHVYTLRDRLVERMDVRES